MLRFGDKKKREKGLAEVIYLHPQPGVPATAIRRDSVPTVEIYRSDLEHVVACYFCDDDPQDNDAVCPRCGAMEPDLEIMERLRSVLKSAKLEL